MKFLEFTKAFKKTYKASNYFNGSITYYSALLFGYIFYKLKIIPNIITIISLILGVLGSILLLNGKYPLASIILFFSVVVDYCDGSISRITNQQSKLGKILDVIVDRSVDTLFWLIILVITFDKGIIVLALITIILITHNLINFQDILQDKTVKEKTSPSLIKARQILYIPLEGDFNMLIIPLLLMTDYFLYYLIFLGLGSFLRLIYILTKLSGK